MAHHRHSVPVTPFQDFCSRVDDLADSDLAYNLRKWEPSHEINLAMNQLYNANAYLRSQYGGAGPLKPWNSPSSPHLHHAHLNPHRCPSSPYTPPRTPVSEAASLQLEQQLSDVNNKLAQCNKLIASQQSELATHRATLAAANKTIQEHEASITGNTSTIKSLRQRLAEQYFAAGRDRDAAEQYTKLEELQKAEANQRRSWHDRSGARAAEARELEATLAKGRAQLREGRYSDAEKAFRHVLRRRKVLFVDEEVRQSETRESQLLLCEALTKSGNSDKVQEAENIYLRSEPLAGLDGMTDADRVWALNNIMTLAHTYAEQKSYRLAASKLSDAWKWRSTVSRSFRVTMEDTAYKIIALCEKRSQPAYAAKAFDVIHPDRTASLSGDALATTARLGVSLFNTGSHDDKATAYLKQSWSHRAQLDAATVRTLGWTLAMLRAHSARWADVRDLIMALPPAAVHRRSPLPTSSSSTAAAAAGPSDDALLALLAHAQLHLHDLPGAHANAAALYAKHGAANLRPGFRWHHADTLVRTLAKMASAADSAAATVKAGAGPRQQQQQQQRFFEAKAVWTTVYAAAVAKQQQGSGTVGFKGETEAEARRKDLKRHTEAGLALAEAWRESALRRGKVPRSADEVRVQADGVGRMVAR